VRSHTVIEAVGRPDGSTAVPRMLDSDQIGVRLTSPGRPGRPTVVHLIGTAAGPLGGDDMRVSVRVAAGARLEVRGSAATIALPGGASTAGEAGRYAIDLEVEDGGELVFAPEPTVVCARADLRSTTTALLAGSARLRIDERVGLGRHGEEGGDWTGRLVIVRDGLPLVRTTLSATQLRSAAVGARAILSLFASDPDGDCAFSASTSGTAVATPLARGGLLVTAFGPSIITALADRDRAEAASLVPLPA
jgi:urease accessory protein